MNSLRDDKPADGGLKGFSPIRFIKAVFPGIRPQMPQMPLRALRDIGGDRRGVIIVLFALMLPVLVGFIGLGVEVGHWYQQKRGLQTAADAGAISAAFTVWDGGDETAAYSAAKYEVERNWTDTFNTSEFDTDIMPPTSGSYTADSNAVEVELTKSASLLFVGYLMGSGTVNITARAVATLGMSSTACVLTLGTTGTGFSAQGNSTVNLNGCAIAVNSSGAAALDTTGGSTSLATECYSVVGGTDFQNEANVTTTCSNPSTGGRAVIDPFASLPEPDTSSMSVECSTVNECKYNSSDNGQDGINAPSAGNPIALSPGIYNSMDIQTYVDLAAGVYVVDGGTFSANASAVITNTDGGGVTFFLTNDATVSINGSASMTLSAPDDDTDDYYGILFYEDRDNTTGNAHTFNGGANIDIDGSLYFPQGDVTITGNASMDSDCIQVIGYTVTFSGDADMDINCPMLSAGSGNSINIYNLQLVE